MRKHKPYRPYTFGISWWTILTVVAFSILNWYTNIPLLVTIVTALNISTFALYGIDKLFAINQSRRIPERVLYIAAFTGGAAGALAGMYTFRHKVSKLSFKFGLTLVILLEIALIAQYLHANEFSIKLY